MTRRRFGMAGDVAAPAPARQCEGRSAVDDEGYLAAARLGGGDQVEGLVAPIAGQYLVAVAGLAADGIAGAGRLGLVPADHLVPRIGGGEDDRAQTARRGVGAG